jgi:hypothetical protein
MKRAGLLASLQMVDGFVAFWRELWLVVERSMAAIQETQCKSDTCPVRPSIVSCS